MQDQRKDDQQPPQPPRTMFRGSNLGIAILILGIVLLATYFFSGPRSSKITYSFLMNQIDGLDAKGNLITDEAGNEIKDEDGNGVPNIQQVVINNYSAKGTFKTPPAEPDSYQNGVLKEGRKNKRLEEHFIVSLPESDSKARDELIAKLESANIPLEFEEPNNAISYIYILLSLFIVGIVLMMWVSYRRSQNQMLGGGGFLSGFSKSPAKRYESSSKPITFKDVAGLEGVKADLQEIVDYLTDPQKFQKLGGRVPKGVLLNGPPGTGKTLLARAIAGEAEVPFYSVNGSEFIQMFVGVGASRVRDLFKTAKEHAPAIIFIDEIDAVGRQRGAGLGGGHDEREQTLNQILGEMDGFMGNDSVIVVAATNRPDVLDPALLRPGRFDRHISVNRPTQKGRFEIFKVHVRDVPLSKDVDLQVLAAGSVGLTGADIRNIVNEAALWAARNNKNKVEMSDFEYARDKVLMGAKREEVLTEKDKEKTAYHEAGHTLAAWHLKGAYPVHKVTIIPRGQALGVTHMLPGEDRMNMAESEIRDQLVVLLAGRAAEQLIYEEVTVGAENDLERATSIARRMVTSWGMSQRLGPVSFKMTDEDPFLGREMHQQRQFSEHTMEMIDEEITSLLRESAKLATELLTEKRDQLDALAESLVKEEELGTSEIEAIVGPSVHPSNNGRAAKADSDSPSPDSDQANDATSDVDNESPTEAHDEPRNGSDTDSNSQSGNGSEAGASDNAEAESPSREN